MIEEKMENNYSTYRHFFKLKIIGGEVADFFSIKSDDYDESSLQDSDHFKWIEYNQVREEVEEESVIKTNWWVVIDDKKVTLLDNLVRGAIYKENSFTVLPKIDYGTLNPELFVFDEDLNEWKSPTFDAGSTQVWDKNLKKYVEKNN